MSDKFSIDVEAALERFGKSLENLGSELEEQVNVAVRDIAYATHAEIVAKAQTGLNATRNDYLKALEFVDLGDNSYLISLNGSWANQLEKGYGSYNLTEKLLKSQKIVDVGSRSGEPWVQKAQDGHKFAHVPLHKNPTAKGGRSGDLAAQIKNMKATNASGRKQKITSVFKDVNGNPQQGKVAIGRSENPYLDQLVKYQKTMVNEKTGKAQTSSIYINYRTISEIAEPWMHPGFEGLHAFEDAQAYVEKQLNDFIVINLFKD